MKPACIAWMLCALLGACASQPKEPPKILMQGFAIVPPAEKEWVVANRTATVIVLGKAGRFSGQTLTLSAAIVELPPAASPAEMVRHVESMQRKRLDSPRYKLFTMEASEYALKGQTCVMSRIEMAERTAAAGTTSPVNMRVESLTLICPHPDNPSRGIDMTYSHRHFPEDADPNFWQEAAVRVQSLAFEPL